MEAFKNISIDMIVHKLIPSKLIEISMISSIFVITIYGLKFMSSKEELLSLLGIYTIAAYRIMPSINRIMIALNGITENQYVFPVLEKLINFKSDGNKKVSEIVFTD